MRSRNKTPLPTLLAFLLPSLLGFCIFILYPIIAGLALSFTDFSGGFSYNFIGFENYKTLLIDSQFRHSLGVTFRFSFFSISLVMILSLVFALLLNKPFKGRDVIRGVFVLPSVLSMIAISLAVIVMFDPRNGIINSFLVALGFEKQGFLSDPNQVLGVIIFTFVWQNVGYYMIIFLGGLQSIPKSLYEAAEIDGANSRYQFFKVTLPMLSPVTFLCFILLVIRSFQSFNEVYMLTGGSFGNGGPNGAANVLGFNIFLNSFTHYRMGYASAQAMVLLLLVLSITIFQYSMQKRWVTYES